MKTKQSSNRTTQASFVSGVFILSLSTVIVKVIGLFYKIPMLSYLGAQGMGYFNSAYEIYALLCVISTAGLPTALSMLVASYSESGVPSRIRAVYKTAMYVFLIIGVIGSALLLVFAREIAFAIENAEAYYCILAIAPALLCVCVSSAVRGYFQGLRSMMPTAVSQLIEAVGKLVFGIAFAKFAISKGYSLAIVSAFAVSGISLGTLISAVYLLILKRHANKKRDVERCEGHEKGVVKALLRIAFPITLSSAVISLTRIIDMALIMRRLQDIGYTSGAANEVYGAYTTVAVPIFSLVPSLLAPISLALVPELSGAIERSSGRAQTQIIDSSLRLTALLAMPSTFALSLYAKPIISILFSSSAGLVDYISPVLSILSLSVLFSCMITTTNAILQSYRQTFKPIISMAFGAILKMIVAYILIGIPSVNIYGAPISTFACDAVVTVINLIFIRRSTAAEISVVGVYLKPLAASSLAMLTSLGAYLGVISYAHNDKLAFVVAAPIAIIAYFVISILIRSVTPDDIAMLPMGDKINKFLLKMTMTKNKGE